jgi:tetratricopeptide (TPR) repeat protein
LYAQIPASEGVTFSNKLHLIVGYIYKNFEFGEEKDRKEFFKNQHLWEQVAQKDCRLIYSDIGSHSTFNLYYEECKEKTNKERFTFLLDNYICKISQLSSEVCLEKKKFSKIMKIYQTFFLIKNNNVTTQTLSKYNNIAYYLQKAGANKEAIFLLEKIVKKFPNRTVAYYNLGDAYWELGEKDKAIKAYTTYIEQMCNKGLQKKIPKEVLKRVEVK